ncbi:MAG: cyclic nucleotide-binding domain-containing protein [Hyphomicrobiales bacterium]|nr:cyclic nucleotide-binding domain-containing protein [Hyphomicrobiales bacterium]
MARMVGTLVTMLDRRSMSARARLYRRVEAALVLVGLLSMVVVTTTSLGEISRLLASSVLLVVMLIFLIDAVVRIALSRTITAHERLDSEDVDVSRWIGTAWGALDVLTILPMAIAAPFYWTPSGAPLLASLWLFRFVRYSRGGRILMTVILREREPILGVLLLFAIVLTGGAVLAFLAERNAQPKVFTSLATSLWWAITTLTTTGYGDMAPVTLLGRMVAGAVMIGGLGTISLLAGILATGFAAELKRTEFLRSWDMISKVSFFENAGAATIADVAALLRPRDFPARSVVTRRGQPGDCMYFIVDGEVEILIEPKTVRLGPGAFFGEIAILTGAPRNATVVTTKVTQLLTLDIADFRALAASRPELTDLIRKEADLRLGKIADTDDRRSDA